MDESTFQDVSNHVEYIENDKEEMIAPLNEIEKNDDDDSSLNKNTKLHFSSALGNLDDVKHDLDTLKSNIDAENFLGWTPLMMAVRNGNIEVVKYLLEKRADVTKKNKFGINIFMMSITDGNLELMKLILRHLLRGGISRNRIQDFISPLSLAVLFQSNVEILNWLVYESFDLNASTLNSNLTPIMFASASRNTEAIKFLLTKHADENCVNYMGLQYRDLALWRKRGLKIVLMRIKERATSSQHVSKPSKEQKRKLNQSKKEESTRIPNNTPASSPIVYSQGYDHEKLTKFLMRQQDVSNNPEVKGNSSPNNSRAGKKLRNHDVNSTQTFPLIQPNYPNYAAPFNYIVFPSSPYDNQSIGPLTPVMIHSPAMQPTYPYDIYGSIQNPMAFMSPCHVPMTPQVFFPPNIQPLGCPNSYPEPMYLETPQLDNRSKQE